MRAAIIGLGPHGKRVAEALRALPGVELAAVVDLRDDALAWPELGPNVLKTKDAAEAWRAGIDVACITTNGPSHAALACAAMEAGVRRVLVEKPMACSADECDRMMAVAAATNSRLSVNQSRRHDPFYRWLRDEIRSGALGQPRCLWIQRPGIGLGCLGTHYFDLAAYLFDRPVTRVTAWVDPFIGPNPRGAQFVDPGGLVVMELGAGARAIVAQIEDGAGPMSVEVDLTAARVMIDERSGNVELIARDLSVKPGPGKPPAYATRAIPAGLTAKTNVGGMLKGALEELVGDGPLECEARHGLASVEVLAAAHLSHQRGQLPVTLPLSSSEDRGLWLPVT